MTGPSFGLSGRMHAQAAADPWVQRAGRMFWWGMLTASLFWWNGLLDPQEAPKQFLFALVLVVTAPFLWMALQRHQVRRPFSWAVITGLSGLFLSVLVAWIVAPDHWLGLLGVAGSISTTLFSWLIAFTACLFAGTLTSLGWKPSSTSLYIFLSVVLIFTGFHRFGWLDLSSGGIAARLFSPFGNALALAWLIACVALAALASEYNDHQTSSGAVGVRRVFLGLAICSLVVLDQAALWWVWLLGIAGIAVAFGRELLHTRKSLLLIVAALIGAAGLIWNVPQSSAIPTVAILSASESWRVVKTSCIQNHCMFGSGLGQWSHVFESIRPLALNLGSLLGVRFDVGGAFWWTLLLQQGVFGALAWIFFLFVASFQIVLKIRTDRAHIPLAISVGAAVLSTWFVHPHGWGLLALFVAFGVLLAGSYESSVTAARALKAKIGLLALILLAIIPFSARRLLADRAFHQVEDTQNIIERRALTQAGFAHAPWFAENAYTMLEIEALWLHERIQSGDVNPATLQKDMAVALEQSKQATARWPREASLWLAQGGLYAVLAPVTQGADQFALQAYQQGLTLAPHHPGFPLGMAQIFLQRAAVIEKQALATKDSQAQALSEARLEQLRLAAQWFKRALEQKPDDRSVRYAYAITLARAGDFSGALPLLKALVDEEPARTDLLLEYATVLAANNQRAQAIDLAKRVGSQDRAYLTAQRLLVGWYEAERRWAEALASLRTMPPEEQQTPAFRQHLNQLQSRVGSATR